MSHEVSLFLAMIATHFTQTDEGLSLLGSLRCCSQHLGSTRGHNHLGSANFCNLMRSLEI
jgi:hypothetical protein